MLLSQMNAKKVLLLFSFMDSNGHSLGNEISKKYRDYICMQTELLKTKNLWLRIINMLVVLITKLSFISKIRE